MYVTSFTLPTGEQEERFITEKMMENGGKYGYIDNLYPCRIFTEKGLQQLDFGKITILYGSNGSGKSTLLNLIAARLELNRVAPHNSGELFDRYAAACDYEMGYDDEGFRYRIPNGSRIITSDDVFDYMLAMRTANEEISERIIEERKFYNGEVHSDTPNQLAGLDDYERFRKVHQARKKSVTRRQYIREYAGKNLTLRSNGETALQYFDTKLKNDTLSCLDEPENSLAPALQMKLADMLTELVRYCGCQLIIATHSPFLLALPDAWVLDLDSAPVREKNWWELENIRSYFDFFWKHKDRFLR
ncbi:MAG: AAA family ATPase [Clostridia bacterium]|nr:AAA family ATPase [Clostridia bacterium]